MAKSLSRLEAAQAQHGAVCTALAAVESAIAEKRAALLASVPDENRVKAAKTAVEDALAIQATGGKAGDLDALRAELGAAETTFEADSISCSIIAKDLGAAIAGLERRRESLQAEHGAVQHAFRDAVQEALESERDDYFRRYVAAANEVAACYCGVMALARVASRSNYNIGALWSSVTTPALPAPRIGGLEIVGHVSGDPANCFTPVSLAGLIDKAESAASAKFGALLN